MKQKEILRIFRRSKRTVKIPKNSNFQTAQESGIKNHRNAGAEERHTVSVFSAEAKEALEHTVVRVDCCETECGVHPCPGVPTKNAATDIDGVVAEEDSAGRDCIGPEVVQAPPAPSWVIPEVALR